VNNADQLPSGTVTFLFTDIENSTPLWEQHADDMRTAVTTSAAVLGRAVEAHSGHVVKSTGDGIMAVFDDATRGVEAAISAQRDLASAPAPVQLGVRMGLHTGAAEPIAGDYLAPAVNRADRICATAHPGQILVSDAVAALTDGVELLDLGEHRLKGLAPMRLHQVVADGLRRDFPPTSTSTSTGIPAQSTSFVGRRAEVAEVSRLLTEHRLVTLTGAGGCGKTRLAIEIALERANEFRDGVRFVDLAATTDDAVAEAVADALGLAASLGTADDTRLPAYVAAHDLLIVFDNCEHLLAALAELLDGLLARAGPSRMLATSREPLGLVGEQVFRVASLDVTSDASQLFIDRARAVRADLVVDDAARHAIERICDRLDGIPLAIELAAARIAHLAPAQVLERLDDRFRLLTGGQRRVARQATLEATLDWSYALLDDGDKQALRALAAFPASFRIEAAERVLATPDALERVGSLVTKSLVHMIDAPGGARYRLLETVRLYAETKLLQDTREAVQARTRHRDGVRDWLASMPLGQRWLGDDDLLASGLPSVRAALEWSAARDELEIVGEIAAGVDWTRSEASSEASRWCLLGLQAPALPPERAVELLLMLWWLDPLSAVAPHLTSERALAVAIECRSELLPVAHVAVARDAIVPAILRRDESRRARALTSAATAVELSKESSPPWPMYCRLIAIFVHMSFGQPELAAEHAAVAIAAPPEAPFLDLHATLRAYAAIAALVLGDDARAVELARSSYTPEGLTPYWQHPRAIALVALAASGDHDTARQSLHDYHAASRGLAWFSSMDSVILLGGVLAGMREDWPTCSLLLAASTAAIDRTPADALLYWTFRDRARAVLGHERSQELRAAGRALSTDAALARALE
jgi:predicted ATPase/class 3 adenylate cyclase